MYCGQPTQVTNSRRQKQRNHVWRRRACQACGGTFTTHEQPDLAAGLRVQHADGALAPFDRDALFLSIHASCKHRAQAVADARALTYTIVARAVANAKRGVIQRGTIVVLAREVLARFDRAASTMYTAYHPSER